MNPYHVKYFVDAVRLGGVGESARANRVTHPAVSQAIRTLESDLSVNLTKHRRRIFELTAEGEAFYQRASDWLETLESVKSDIRSLNGELTGQLNFGSPQSLTADYLGPAIFRMKKAHPKVNLRVSFNDAAGIKDQVRKGFLNAGLLIDDQDLGGLSSKTICSGKFIAISSRPRRRFDADPWIVTRKQKFEVQTLLSRLEAKHGTLPEIFLEMSSWSLLRKIALTEDVICLVPEYVVTEDLVAKRLHRVSLGVEEPTYTVKCVWRSGTELSRLARSLLGYIEV